MYIYEKEREREQRADKTRCVFAEIEKRRVNVKKNRKIRKEKIKREFKSVIRLPVERKNSRDYNHYIK